jgi:hypothetical protein
MANTKKILGYVFIGLSVFCILLILTMYNDLKNAENVFELLGELTLYSYFMAILIVVAIISFIVGIVLLSLGLKADKKEIKEVYTRNK